MNVAVTGSSGLLGGALVRQLRADGHQVVRLVRRRPVAEDEVLWYPELDTAGLAGVQAVVHLVGETMAGRWSEHQREAIRASRVGGTRTLAEGLAGMANPPKALLSASAIGIYGDRGDEELTERSAPGEGFLAEVHRDAERATEVAGRAGIRVTHLRFGLVQSTEGGVLPSLLPWFRRGLGIRAGHGNQYVSWITLTDVARAISHLLDTRGMAGPVNVVAPNPVTNREYADTLAKVINRPRFLTLPPGMARVVYGPGLADEVLLSSTRVLPERLLASGFTFAQPTFEGALKNLLLAVTSDDER